MHDKKEKENGEPSKEGKKRWSKTKHIYKNICKGNLESRTIERDHQVEEGSVVLGAQTRRMGSFLEAAEREESDVSRNTIQKGSGANRIE